MMFTSLFLILSTLPAFSGAEATNCFIRTEAGGVPKECWKIGGFATCGGIGILVLLLAYLKFRDWLEGRRRAPAAEERQLEVIETRTAFDCERGVMDGNTNVDHSTDSRLSGAGVPSMLETGRTPSDPPPVYTPETRRPPRYGEVHQCCVNTLVRDSDGAYTQQQPAGKLSV